MILCGQVCLVDTHLGSQVFLQLHQSLGGQRHRVTHVRLWCQWSLHLARPSGRPIRVDQAHRGNLCLQPVRWEHFPGNSNHSVHRRNTTLTVIQKTLWLWWKPTGRPGLPRKPGKPIRPGAPGEPGSPSCPRSPWSPARPFVIWNTQTNNKMSLHAVRLVQGLTSFTGAQSKTEILHLSLWLHWCFLSDPFGRANHRAQLVPARWMCNNKIKKQ